MVGGEIALRLTATAPVGWRLTSSFADLTGTMAADLSFSTAPKLVLRSHPGDGKGAGLWFDGTLDLRKDHGWAIQAPGPTEQPIKGTIEMRDAARVVGVRPPGPLVRAIIDLKLVTIDELTFRVGSHLTCNPFTRDVFGGPLCWHERVDPIPRPGKELFAAPLGGGRRPRPGLAVRGRDRGRHPGRLGRDRHLADGLGLARTLTPARCPSPTS